MPPCRSRSSSPRSHCGNRCLAAGASGASGGVSLLQPSKLRCVPRLFSALCLFASSSSRCFAVSWTFQSFWMGENVCPARNVKPIMKLFDVLHHLLVHVILHLTKGGPGLWYSSRAANLSHSSFPAGFRWSHCENCVVRIELVRLVLVDDDAFPDGRGEL